MVSDVAFKSLIYFVFFCVWCKIRFQFYSFLHEYPVFSTSFIEETFLIGYSRHLCQNRPYMCGRISELFNLSHWFMSVFIKLPYCCNYCRFVMYFEISKCEAFSFILLSQDDLAIRDPFWFYLNFRAVLILIL